jgi:putative CocE/NonD family hydrolase
MKPAGRKHARARRALLKSIFALISSSAVGGCVYDTSSSYDALAVRLKKKLAIREIENIWIPLPDGRRLAARIWLPTNAESSPVPAILEYLPYRKRDLARLRHEPAHVYAAACGYAGVRVDIRGTGESDGILKDEYLEQEQLDGLEVLKWLADQPWCSGSVGMRGISWGGFNSLQIAARRPPELKAIITHGSTDDRYADDAHYIGGSLSRPNFEWGQLFMNVLSLPPDPEIFGIHWKKEWIKRLQAVRPVTHNWLRHQRRDSYWQHGSVNEDYSKIQCPVYAVGGFVDAYTNSIPRLLAHLKVPRKALIGPHGHDFPDEANPGPAIGFLHEEVRWWDQWLKGIDTGVMDEPMLQVYMQEKAPGQVYPDDVPGRWVAEREWPSRRIRENTYYLNATVGLTESPATVEKITLTPDQSIGLTNTAWLPFAMESELPRDQSEDDNKSLIFDSGILEKDLEICGQPKVKLTLSANKPVARLAVRLNEIRSDGSSWNVTCGYLNLTHRQGHDQPRALVPGEVYEVEVSLNMIAYRFKTGHRIRLAVSESYWPMIWPSPEPVALTVHTGVSQLVLPERPPETKDLESLQFSAPVPADESARTRLRPGTFNQEISGPDENGSVLVKTINDSGTNRINKIGTEMRIQYEWVSTIKKIDPNSAFWGGFYSIELKRDDWHIKTKSNFELTSDKTHFHIVTDLVVYEKNSIIFAHEWKDSVIRDFG